MNNYKHETGTFSGKGGVEIFFQKWIAPKAKSALIIVHDLGDHSGRYENIVKGLSGKNISVLAMDLRGHGRSEGTRGHVNSFMDYIYDLKLLVEYIKSEYKKIPIILLGQGAGGVVATRYALTYSGDVSRLALASPSFESIYAPSGVKKRLVSFLSPRLADFNLSTKLDVSSLSRDKSVVDAYREDKLVHGKTTARWIEEYAGACEDCLQSAHGLKCPVLVFQGKADTVSNYEVTEKFYDSIKTNKNILLYDELYHETLNELTPDREKVVEDVVKWITAKSAGVKSTSKKSVAKTTKKTATKSTAKKSAAKAAKKTATKSTAKKSSAKAKKKTATKSTAKKSSAKAKKKTATKSTAKKSTAKTTKKT